MSEETFLDVPTGDAVEPKAMPAGEYKLRITSALMGVDKNGHDYFLPRFEIPKEPFAKEFTRFFGLPHSEMTDKQVNAAKFNLDSFKKCFKIKKDKFSMDEIIGMEGWAILGLGEDDEYGEQNYIKKFILPK